MKYFLDTNIISYILNGNANVKSQIEKLILNGDEFSIPIFSYYEIKRGLLAVNATSKLVLFDNFVKVWGLTDISLATYDLAANVYAKLKKQGAIIEDADLFIGCSALENNAVLISNNIKHLGRIPNLQIKVVN